MDTNNKDSEVHVNPFENLMNDSSEVVNGDVSPSYMSQLVHRLFGLTLDNGPGRPPGAVLLSDLASPGKQIDKESLGPALFERLILENPSECIKTFGTDSHIVQTNCIDYLFESYRRLNQEVISNKELRDAINLFIIQNTTLALLQPVVFNNQDTHLQVVKLFETDTDTEKELVNYLRETADYLLHDEGAEELKQAFTPLLVNVHNDFKQANIITFSRSHLVLISMFASYPPLAQILMDYLEPGRPHVPLSYSETLFGSILNISCLPKTSEGQYQYFDSHDFTAIKAVERSMWAGLEDLGDKIHSIVELLLRDNNQRKRVLSWFGRCLDANIARGKLWASVSHPFLPVGVGYISDAFAMNMASVLLRLCRPFIDPTKSKDRLLKIDPTYPAAVSSARNPCQIKSFAGESCLQPTEENETKPIAKSDWNFLTELFHMTHRAIDLSVRVLLDRVQSLYQDMARLQQMTVGTNTDVITQTLKLHMPKFVTMRCVLLEPQTLSLLSQFEVATCVWLTQVLIAPYDQNEPPDSYAPFTQRTLTFPLSSQSPPTLKCIPEMILESVEVWLRLCKQYSSESLESVQLDSVLTTLLVFMSSKHRTRNPHLRAKLAQSLEALLPQQDNRPEFESTHSNPLGTFNRTALFNTHPHASQIVESLLNVFVSIEMTGESVEFEQKFNYRRPMYIVMDYLWTIELHRQSFRSLSKQAEENMEGTDAPLFLRFLNLLINDAIFLLDEALTNMAQLRTMLTAREGGEWEQLGTEERRRNEQLFQQTGMIARYDNILGKETIHTLRYMSSEIRSLLCHSTMVDRIAAMLNYFLYRLVGPNKKNFKVKYQDEYKFEPSTIVKDICRIYVSLGESDEFCKAVSRDGRSYSPQLFKYAIDVLARIGGGSLVVDLELVATRIEERHNQLETEEELMADCPEEFLDPIMSTLMIDPVFLPTSRITCDRSTIARHLLSDQSDPFNRAPLTMNMVESNLDLKTKINNWLEERRKNKSQQS